MVVCLPHLYSYSYVVLPQSDASNGNLYNVQLSSQCLLSPLSIFVFEKRVSRGNRIRRRRRRIGQKWTESRRRRLYGGKTYQSRARLLVLTFNTNWERERDREKYCFIFITFWAIKSWPDQNAAIFTNWRTYFERRRRDDEFLRLNLHENERNITTRDSRVRSYLKILSRRMLQLQGSATL